MLNLNVKYIFLLLVSVLTIIPAVSQETDNQEVLIDSLYREDQFYIGVTYNLLDKMPSNVSQSGFSSGFHLGFIRDIPINTKRNIAIGLGVGYSTNSYNQNIIISKESGNYTYSVIEQNFTKNKFYQHLVEVPLEFRYRKSTPTEHKFFRVYAGFKLGYVFADGSKFRGDPYDVKLTNIKDFNDIQTALTLSIGYNTWNFYFQYGLNKIFDSSATINDHSIDMKTIKIGLIFYIL